MVCLLWRCCWFSIMIVFVIVVVVVVFVWCLSMFTFISDVFLASCCDLRLWHLSLCLSCLCILLLCVSTRVPAVFYFPPVLYYVCSLFCISAVVFHILLCIFGCALLLVYFLCSLYLLQVIVAFHSFVICLSTSSCTCLLYLFFLVSPLHFYILIFPFSAIFFFYLLS